MGIESQCKSYHPRSVLTRLECIQVLTAWFHSYFSLSATLKPQAQLIRDGNTLLSVREESINFSEDITRKESVTAAVVDDESESVERNLSITGTACLTKARIIASISGLNLTFVLKNLNSTFHKRKSTGQTSTIKKPGILLLYKNFNYISMFQIIIFLYYRFFLYQMYCVVWLFTGYNIHEIV